MSEPTQGINDLPAQHPEDTTTPTTQAEAKDGDDATTKPDPSLCGSVADHHQSCSVACNKIHRENHPPEPEPAPAPAPTPTAPQSALSESQATSLHQLPDPSNPFQALESSEKLRLLFRKYPGLPDQLRKIDAATLPPPETKPAIPASLLKGLPPKQEAWNHDIGIQNGKEALRKARRADGEQGDAIREYSELILHLMNTESAQTDVDNIIRQKMAQEDTKLIERLMAQEKR
ncbi:hypothetical protein BFJ72_g2869 [Fusarium proliferatum]|uniref:Uncharacterized protein n=1 Tax=Gibberella intermedia TaxID=948311 RepID=A0A420TWM2_GIBIN|nr:hypothetical protein BFJ72_g2869 [Fusarium proliferatum]